MKKGMVNLILWILFTLMQCGPIVGTLEYGEGGPLESLWLMVPFSLLCLGLVLLTTGYAVPRLLLRRKWGAFSAFEFSLSYFISLIEQLFIVYIWREWDIMPPDNPIHWDWLNVNAFCNSLMLFFTLLAVGGWYLFDTARRDLKRAREMTDRIEGYISAVRRMLRPKALSRRLKEIAEKVEERPREAEKDIDALASDLRESLYNLPKPPSEGEPLKADDMENRKFNRLITARRYHAARVMIFQFSLICICFGAFFATPDQPEFSSRFGGFLVLLGMFEIIAAIDIFVFFRSFRKTRRRGCFILKSGILAAVIILPILIERVILYANNPDGNEGLFILVTGLATLASVLMILFYIAGIGAMLLYQDWVCHTHRLVRLQATTRRLEYANLKKQINPHFLFNILNSAGILTMIDPSDASDMLLELRRLIDYQFEETERPVIRLSESISFLNSYLRLEATRRAGFRFSINCAGEVGEVEVPTLLFIPFVENAVKYAQYPGDGEMVKVSFVLEGERLVFTCENPVGEMSGVEAGEGGGSQISGVGGLGIANTLRRLDLLYDDAYSYCVIISGGRYRVILAIPLARCSLSAR